MGSIPWFLFLSLHCWCMGMQLISVHWFYILRFCWIHESFLAVFGGIFWVFHIEYHVICEEWKFDLLLANLDAFYFFVLSAETKTSNTMLNNSGESGHPCLVPDLRGKALSCFPLRMILVLGRSYMAFIILRYAPSIPTFLRVFIRKGCGILSNAFSASIERIYGSCPFFYWCDESRCCFADIEWDLHPTYKSHLFMVNNFFNVLLDPVG